MRRRTSRTPRADKRKRAKPPTVAGLAAEKLSDGGLYTIWYETYGPDGEILEAWEGRPLAWRPGIDVVQVSATGYAEPKTDWRERRVVPPRGVHPWTGRLSRPGEVKGERGEPKGES